MKSKMNNKRGYTLIEVMFVIVISSVVFYGLIAIPFDLAKTQHSYSETQSVVYDYERLRSSIQHDLPSGNVKALGSKELEIGGEKYSFQEKVLRNGKKITDSKFYYELSDGVLRIYNNEMQIKYSYNSSFTEVAK